MSASVLPHGRLRLARSSDPAPNRTAVLAIVLACQLMIVLDVTVIITALPDIHRALAFSSTGLSWVQNAYTLAFGGLLLLGARAGDIVGRRRAFMAGLGLFTAASLAGGLADSAAWLVAARSAQGVGAAIAAPATLALLTSSFREGAERTRALAFYSAVTGGGGSVGLVAGGMLTAWISWRWGLFLNVPIGVAMIALAPRFLPETPRRRAQFDLPGAIASTVGVTALVYGFVRAASDGWGDAITVGSFAVGLVLLTVFVLVERRAEQPITPLRLFASRTRSGAYLARVLLVGSMFSMFFFVSQYFQGVLGYSPLRAGIAFLPQTLVLFATVQIVPRLAARIGTERMLLAGLGTALAGMAWLSRVDAGTAYFPGVALPLLVLGLGIGIAFIPLTAAGISGVAPEDAGAASGLVNVSQQLGASLGLGILVTVFAAAGGPGRLGLAHGVTAALTGSVVLLALALGVAAASVRRPRPVAEEVLELAEAEAA
jgi:EmrB/QacA subfamily drug resistance transporter